MRERVRLRGRESGRVVGNERDVLLVAEAAEHGGGRGWCGAARRGAVRCGAVRCGGGGGKGGGGRARRGDVGGWDVNDLRRGRRCGVRKLKEKAGG